MQTKGHAAITCSRLPAGLIVAALAAVILATNAAAQNKWAAGEKRERIDTMAKETLDELFMKSSSAKELYDKAVAYAVFDNLKLSLMISVGGGHGVAVKKDSHERIYMKMGTAGLNIGLGGQKYQVIFLFETTENFTRFVEKGWEAEASANAVAGRKGANVETTFRNGIAFYQITQAGLMLQADIAGTKYWKNKKLNKKK